MTDLLQLAGLLALILITPWVGTEALAQLDKLWRWLRST